MKVNYFNRNNSNFLSKVNADKEKDADVSKFEEIKT
jgi:hypothetical protein